MKCENTIITCDPDDIIVPENRVRKEFDKKKIKELAESITRLNFQIQNGVCVKTEDGKYELVAGERRLRACQEAKVPFAFCLVEEADEELLLEIEIEENLTRAGLTWSEEVNAKERLHMLRQKQAQTLGRDQSIRKTAIELHESHGSVGEALELVKYMNVFPEVRDAKTITEAKKAVKKIKGSALRNKLLTTAMDKAEESKARVDGEVLKNETSSEAVFELGGMEFNADRILDFDKRVIHEEAEQALTKFHDSSIHVMFFDPPWGVNYTPDGQRTAYKDDKALLKKLNDWLPLLYSKMAENSHLYMFFGIVYHGLVYHKLKKAGFQVNKMPIYWIKQGIHRTRNPEIWPGRSVEPIAFARKGQRQINQGKQGAADYVITPSLPSSARQEAASPKHPDIYLELLKRSVLPGDTVVDPMCGSGMLGVAANVLKLTHKLDWWLIEKDLTMRQLALENCIKGYHECVITDTKKTILSTDPSDFKVFAPGTPEWKKIWDSNPELQGDMFEFAKERR